MNIRQNKYKNRKKITQDNIIYSLNNEKCTAALIGCISNLEEILIPRSIIYKSQEYIVTKIKRRAFIESSIRSIKFASDSKIRTIEDEAFYTTSIESLTIPSSLIKLKRGWCNETRRLTHIEVCPNNPRYSVYENKYLIGKSSIEQENYDVLLFCVRDIQNAVIPDFIEIIEKYAFDECLNHENIQFSTNSKIRIFDEDFISCSSIEELSIPSSVVDLKDGWCGETTKLNKITVIPGNPRYSVYDDKYLIGKSSMDIGNYDVLLFCNRNIETALIPDFIEVIGGSAFSECQNLQSVQFSINSKLRIIGKFTFCASSITNISIPSSVQHIGESAFLFCKYLVQFEIPSNSELRRIEKFAFKCTSIKKILIPSMTEFSTHWYINNINLRKFIIMPDNPYYSVYKDMYLLGKSSIEKENFDVLLFCTQKVKNAHIPDFIEIIGPCAFWGCKNLQQVEFSDNSKLRIIGDFAFTHSSIKSFNIPPSVIEINKYAFAFCKELKNFGIPINSELKLIKTGAFKNSSIEKIIFPPQLKQIGKRAFLNCNMLEYVVIPENSHLKVIKSYAFQNTSIKIINIPFHLTEIGIGAFYDCNKLGEIIISRSSELQRICNNAFNGTSIESLLIPSNLTELEEGWCNNTPQLNAITVMPDNSYYLSIDNNKLVIGKSSIDKDTYDLLIFCARNIIYIKIPDYIEIISPYAFHRCEIGFLAFSRTSKLRIIGSYAFSFCNLDSISLNSEFETIGINSFYNTQITSIFLDESSFDLEKANLVGLSNLDKIEMIKKNTDYSIYQDNLIISKSSSEQDYYNVLNFSSKRIDDVFIPDTIEVVDKKAFCDCNFLKKIYFSKDSKLRIIDRCAFQNSSIENIEFPSSLVELKDGWCCDTKKLIKFSVMPKNKHFICLNGVFLIGKTEINSINFDFLILARRNIKNAIIPSFIKKIGSYSFSDCTQLNQINFPFDSELREIGEHSFENSAITSFYVQPHIIRIDDFAFNKCNALSHIEIPVNSELQIIGNESFSFSSIQSIVIPSSVNEIGNFAFNSCNLLQIIEFAENNALFDININMFINCNDILIMFPANESLP